MYSARKIVLVFVLVAALLAACGQSSSDNASTPDGSATEDGDAPSFDVSEFTNLVYGIFRLEDTDLAITSEQAEELVTLFKLYRSLLNSDNVAAEERATVEAQIEAVMTDDQLAVIADLEFSGEDIQALMEEYGVTMGGVGDGDRQPPESVNPGDFGPGAGGGPGRGQGQGMGGSDENLSPEQIETMQAMREEMGGGGGNRNVLPLLDPLIELLEGKL